MNIITVRFNERQYYDINVDCDVVEFWATTNKGTYHSRFVADGSRSVLDKRKEFKSLAAEAIQRGDDPCEISLDS